MRILLAILLVTSVHFGAQLFMPSLPAMATHYNINDVDMVQIVMLYFFGFGLSHLFYGPWLEAVGGRKVFFSGMSIFTLGSLLCYFAITTEMLAFGRVLQGLGAGSPMILSRALVSQAYCKDKLNSVFNGLSYASAGALIVAPLLGGWGSELFGWQLMFLLLGLYLLVIMAFAVMFLPFDIKRKSAMPFRAIYGDYVPLLSDRHFLCVGIFKWVPTLLFFSAIGYLPFVLQREFGLSEQQYGLYMMLPFCGAMLGGIMSGVLQKYLSARAGLAVFWPLLLVASAILMFSQSSAVTTVIAFSLFMVASGAYYPNCLHLVIQRFKFKSETANSLLGVIDMLVVSVLATLVQRYLLSDLQDLGGLFILGAMVLLVNWLVLHHSIAWRSAEKRLMKMINS